MFSIYLIFPNNYCHSVIICDIYIQSFIHIFAFSYFISHFTHLHIHITYHILMSYSILVIYPCLYMFHTYNLHDICNLILSYHIMVHFRSFTFSFYSYQQVLVTIYISLHITNLYTYLYLYQNLYLFRSPIGVTELIPIRRYLYTYLYFYLSYACIYLILCMNNYDYHICLLFFLISGPNMSSTVGPLSWPNPFWRIRTESGMPCYHLITQNQIFVEAISIWGKPINIHDFNAIRLQNGVSSPFQNDLQNTCSEFKLFLINFNIKRKHGMNAHVGAYSEFPSL